MFFYGGFFARSRSSDDRKGGVICHRDCGSGLIAAGVVPLGRDPLCALAPWREFLADAGSVRAHEKPRCDDFGACARSRTAANCTSRTSGVMEMCIDNPREGFQEMFATQPVRRQARRRPGALCGRTRFPDRSRWPQFDKRGRRRARGDGGRSRNTLQKRRKARAPPGAIWPPRMRPARPSCRAVPPIELGRAGRTR